MPSMQYKLFVPKQSVGADLVYFDFFNATGSGGDVYLESVQAIVSGAEAVSGVVGLELHLTRTTAVGTGGTAATKEGTTLTACTMSATNHKDNLPGEITARLTPTGGATAGAMLSWVSVFTEETNGGTYNSPKELVQNSGGILVREGTGFRVVQNAIASVGKIGFDVCFTFKGR